ncbi:hypothetical protein [Paramaledivibacter caminithermalis]|jgi:hypothetical protein|uniref:DUF2680 domain-containing protein n=1 Tax=Paramaledivibacter caminithermalis (strain DSM 15212 / CIP 107654 / DViRD3) TaxID=1121301 RepID=A0A1M6M327_PARC5|nr:hypothetical protein [Paramaledivibacter caminithermalis]SHJ77743.1 hypothetical protein SAMN02745912_01055 [Paramaledivibacter caminithermalis DSM 15212]
MKKKLLTLTLGAALVLGSIGFAFAADDSTVDTSTTFGRGNGMMLYRSNLSVEELLKEKINIIDQMVREGKLTEEAGENYKKLITERMENCTTPGQNRDKNERLGIGFGRGRGFRQGLKENPQNVKGFGYRNMLGNK